MVKMENHLGAIDISRNFFVNLVGATATSCFGVAGMSVSDPAQGILSKFRKDYESSKGVKIRTRNGKLVIKSIIHKVSYTVEDVTGIRVQNVNVFVDGMRTN